MTKVEILWVDRCCIFATKVNELWVSRCSIFITKVEELWVGRWVIFVTKVEELWIGRCSIFITITIGRCCLYYKSRDALGWQRLNLCYQIGWAPAWQVTFCYLISETVEWCSWLVGIASLLSDRWSSALAGVASLSQGWAALGCRFNDFVTRQWKCGTERHYTFLTIQRSSSGYPVCPVHISSTFCSTCMKKIKCTMYAT